MRAKKLTEFEVWNRTLRNRIRPVSEFVKVLLFWSFFAFSSSHFSRSLNASMTVLRPKTVLCLCVLPHHANVWVCKHAIKDRIKNNKLNFLWPKMARLGPPFWPQKSPRQSLCGSLFCVLSQEMRHINFFSGGPKWGVWGGGQKVYVEKVYVLFRSPSHFAHR